MRKQQEGDGGEGEKELHGAVLTHTQVSSAYTRLGSGSHPSLQTMGGGL